MSLKFAHLVAIQFGIFVGVVSCLLFFRLENPKPRMAAERAPSVASLPDSEGQSTADYRADPEPELVPGQLAPAAPHEYSPEAVERYRALAAKLYYEQIAPRRNASSRVANSSIATVAPAYTELAPEPAVIHSDDPEPQTVAYVEPTQVIVYPQAAVVYSRPRRFVNRCRPAPHFGGIASSPHRRPDRRGTHLSFSPGFSPARSLGVVHRPNTEVPSCRPTQGFKHRGRR